MAITYYVVVPFGPGLDGDLVPLEPMEAQSGEAAKRRAGGLATYGDVDRTMLGE